MHIFNFSNTIACCTTFTSSRSAFYQYPNMASSMNESGSQAKRLKIDDSDLFAAFHDTYLSENPSFLDAVDKFKQEMTAFGAFEIGSCNAADPDNGYCFTKADCTLRPTQKKYAFANFFFDGFKMLKTFITKQEIPKDSQLRLVLGRLVRFLLDTGIDLHIYAVF